MSLWKKQLSRVFFLVGVVFFVSSLGFASNDDLSIRGVWAKGLQNKSPSLVLSVDKNLSRRQMTALNSGFSTYSRFSLVLGADILAEKSCTVKLDTWEEVYNITLLSSEPKQIIVKKFKDYSKECLTMHLPFDVAQRLIQKKLPDGSKLKSILSIEQISREQESRIKKWIIKQQSRVMQGLFSHMLGPLTLAENAELAVVIPPFPRSFRSKE